MGQQVTESYTCDLDGAEIPEGEQVTRSFRLDGRDYEIDLCEKHSLILDEMVAARARRKRGRSRPVADRQRCARIRAWARDNGVEVPDRGRIPRHVTAMYEAEHGG